MRKLLKTVLFAFLLPLLGSHIAFGSAFVLVENSHSIHFNLDHIHSTENADLGANTHQDSPNHPKHVHVDPSTTFALVSNFAEVVEKVAPQLLYELATIVPPSIYLKGRLRPPLA